MKKIVLGMIGIGLVSNLFALSTTDIETKIQEIQNLPAQQRVEQMNQLKEQIRNMNTQEREQAILAIHKTKEKLDAQREEMQHKLKNGVGDMKKHQQDMSDKLTNQKDNMGQHRGEMSEKMDNEIEEHKGDMMDHDMPDIDHERPEIDHDMPDIDHDTPDMDHESSDEDHDK